MRKRICRFYLDGLCLGRGLVHCGVHEREGGCSAGWCEAQEQRVGACEVWSGETVVPYKDEPEFFDVGGER